MLEPKKPKHRKQMKGRMSGIATRGATIAFGDYGLKAMECGWITARQIEAARVAISRHVKRGGKLWIRLFPDKPVTRSRARSGTCTDGFRCTRCGPTSTMASPRPARPTG